jgi:hypothetical protein
MEQGYRKLLMTSVFISLFFISFSFSANTENDIIASGNGEIKLIGYGDLSIYGTGVIILEKYETLDSLKFIEDDGTEVNINVDEFKKGYKFDGTIKIENGVGLIVNFIGKCNNLRFSGVGSITFTGTGVFSYKGINEKWSSDSISINLEK